MDSSRDSEFEGRLARIEAAVAGLQRSVDALVAERRPIPRRRQYKADDIGDNLTAWFSSRSAEWWLSRLGMGFVVLAVLLLYGYAIDHGWITPPIRVFAGAVLGALLFWAAARIRVQTGSAAKADLGFRELLLGGGLAVWYVTAYAASVWYQLIPTPVARLAFFVLGIVSTWIALEERREIFAFVAVATGFGTPFILPAPVESMTQLSLYLGAVTAIGLIVYLMRGWHSIVWLTFVGLWVSVAAIIGPATVGSIALSILLGAAAVAFTRAPLLRRQLLVLGSPRYTPTPVTSGIESVMEAMNSLSKTLGGGTSAPDSLIVWFLMLLSPLLGVGFLGGIWPRVPDEISGAVLVLLGLGALALFPRGSQADQEIAHIELTAAVFWTEIGVGRLLPSPESLPAQTVLAALVIATVTRQFAGPRALAKLTIGLVLMAIAGHELSFADTGLVHLRWVVSEVAALGAVAFMSRQLVAKTDEETQGIVAAVAGYLTALIVVWRTLDPVWAPLVTTSYAILGAVLLILSRREGAHSVFRYLGGVTMLIVAARLLLVDLSSVETIWRVLLFLVCGALFLYTGYRMQPTGVASKQK